MVSRSDFDELLDILELTPAGPDVFLGRHPRKNPVRTFGGQLMAQAFVAASRTLTESLPPSALSVHFIAGGDPARDIEFTVVRLRDERRFANRRVDATQDGKLLATALVSYLSGGTGIEHNFAMPEVPEPDGLPSIDALLVGYEEVVPLFVEAMRPIEWRYTNDPAWVMREKGERLARNRVWMTARGDMPDDPVVHQAAMIYSSDTTVLDSIILTGGRRVPWAGHGALLQSERAGGGDGRPGGHRQALSGRRPLNRLSGRRPPNRLSGRSPLNRLSGRSPLNR